MNHYLRPSRTTSQRFKIWSKTKSKKPGPTRKLNWLRGDVELLEDRSLLAVVGVLASDNTLDISLTAADDVATIRGGSEVIEIFDGNGLQFTAPSTDVSSIRVNGNANGNQSVVFEGEIDVQRDLSVSQLEIVELTGTLTVGSADVVATTEIQMDGTIVLREAIAQDGLRGNVKLETLSGTTTVRGAIDVASDSGRGGNVDILGENVYLADQANVNASGVTGGGRIRIGGGYQGADTGIRNARVTQVDTHVTLYADAIDRGDGGTVVVWADHTTTFSGFISAQGGINGGDGGLVETSGVQRLGVSNAARVSALAPHGEVGEWLLDPATVTVQTGGTSTLAQIADAADTTSNLVVSPSSINAAAANVSIVASQTVTFVDSVNMTNAGVGLDVTAGNLITVDGSITTNNGNVAFRSDEFAMNQAVNVGTGSVLFGRVTAGSISVGIVPGTTTGAADIDTAEIGRITARDLVLGDPSAGQNLVSGISLFGFPASNISRLVQFNTLNNPTTQTAIQGTSTFPSVEFNDNRVVGFTGNATVTTTTGDITINADADGIGTGVGLINAGVTAAINSAANIQITVHVFQQGAGASWTHNANGGNGSITIQRSRSGTVGVGNGSTGGLNLNGSFLSGLTAGTLNIGNPTTPNNTTAINVNSVDLSGITTTSFHTSGKTSFSGASNFASVTTSDGTTTVDNGATVAASSTIAFNTSTVNLDGNLTATGGIIGQATTVNIQGSGGGAEIQDGVDVAASGATVNVAAGSYPSFTINENNLNVVGVGATTIVNAASPAVTVAANGTSVQDMLLQGTGMVDEVGVLLDGTAAANLTGVQIINVDFSNLDDGVRSQGDIGDGVAANVDVTIRGTSSGAPAIFEDFRNEAIDIGDTDGDAIYVVQDIIVRDGGVDGLSTGQNPSVPNFSGEGIQFGSVGGATVNRVDISDTGLDGIAFSVLADANVSVSNSSISAGQHGLNFDGAITGATTLIDIADNTLIEGGQGILVGRNVNDATIRIRGNGTDAANGIRGFDAIAVNNGTLTNATFIVGGDTAGDGNFVATSSSGQALDIDAISGGRFVVANNDLLQGNLAIEFERAISNNAEIVVVDNANISSSFLGVQFQGSIDDASVTIAGNSFTNTVSDAVQFAVSQTITDSTVTIGSAANVTIDQTMVSVGGNAMDGSGVGGGINVQAAVAGTSSFAINDNTIGGSTTRVSADGIRFQGGVVDNATVTIGGNNQVFANGQAIQIDDLQSSTTVAITGGTYDGTGGAVLVDNTGVSGTNGRLNVGAAALVGGAASTVLEVLTDTGNAGVNIDFNGAATLDGGTVGVQLSGPGIDVLNDTLGTISFLSELNTYIALANGAEFLPGSPTIIDSTGVSFNGLDLTVAANALSVESRVIHFLDNPTLGLIHIGALAVNAGNSIQLAVNAAGQLAAPTVTVGAGTFAGSVEVWVDNLTLQGQGATTIIDTDTVDAFANDGDRNSGFHVMANSAIALAGGDADPTGVMIDGFAFDTVTSSGSNFGVALGLLSSSTAIDTTIRNSTFTDLNRGIFSTRSAGTTTITGNVMTAVGRALNFDDSVVAGEQVMIRNNDLTSSGFTVVFDAAAAVTDATVQISGNTLVSSASHDAILFDGTVQNSDVTIGGATVTDANDISGFDEGIDIDGIVGGTFSIIGNTRIDGDTGDAIEFDDNISGNAIINVTGNAQISGGIHGVAFAALAPVNLTNSTVTISGNPNITATTGNGIRGPALIGTSLLTVGGLGAGAENAITAGDDGISIHSVDDTTTANILGANTVDATGDAIDVFDLSSPTSMNINGGVFDGDGGGLRIVNLAMAATTGRLELTNTTFISANGPGLTATIGSLGSGLDVDFNGGGNQFTGTPSMRLEGANLAIIGNTLGDTALNSVAGGDIISLNLGALFEPGQPTTIDATGVSFDGTLGSAMTGNQLLALETQLVHFPDDNTLGLINTNDLFVVSGESIQLAVNTAGLLGGSQTVTVASGTFGGSVEVWVDDLTLQGQGASTIIDTDIADTSANNGDTNTGFEVEATSALSGGGDVTGVTIDGFHFDTPTSAVSSTGVLLGEGGISTSINTTISNNSFNDVSIGILSSSADGNTLIARNFLNAILDRAICFEDGVSAGEQVNIIGNNVTSNRSAIVFDRPNAITNATVSISGNTLASTNEGDAILFAGPIFNSTVSIGGPAAQDANVISGFQDGVDVDRITGGTFTIGRNARIVGGTGDGIQFDGNINGANIQIRNNSEIHGDDHGIAFTIGTPIDVTNASVVIAANADILGTSGNGVLGPNVTGTSTFTFGGDIGGLENAIRAGVDGISFPSIVDTSTVEIVGANTVDADHLAINIADLSSIVTLEGGTHTGANGAMRVVNSTAGLTGRLEIGSVTFFAGSGGTVFDVEVGTSAAGMELDFSGDATFTDGDTGMRLSGAGIDILNDTLGTIAFANQTGNFIEFANGAEFQPGQPTAINAHRVDFDGIDRAVLGNLDLIEQRLVHFPDDGTLGLIDFAIRLTIEDLAFDEGDMGATTFLLTATLSSASDQPIDVEFVVNPGTAVATDDYLTLNGDFTIPAGATSFHFPVEVVGDTIPEPAEMFQVVASSVNSVGPTVTLFDPAGEVTILDDDSLIVVGVKVGSTAWTSAFKQLIDSTGANFGHPIPIGAGQTAPLPWANINQVQLQLNKDVSNSFAANLFGLGGFNISDYRPNILSTIYDASDFTVTITLDTVLGDDQLLLVASDLLTSDSGAQLDGEWTTGQPSSVSGDGFEGGNFEFRFDVLPGDVDQMGTIRSNDGFAALQRQFKDIGHPDYLPLADINGDGEIRSNDGFFALSRQFTELPKGTPTAPPLPHPAIVDLAIAMTEFHDEDDLNVAGIKLEAVIDEFDFSVRGRRIS